MAQQCGRLQGKVALITGAAGGQGRAEARLFAQEGAAVVLTDVDETGGEDAAAAVRAEGGRAAFLRHDVCDLMAWHNSVAVALSQFGGLHVLVNNAGIITRHGIKTVPLASWNRTLDVNLTAVMLGMQVCAPAMRDAGGGSIINVSSIAGMSAHYDAAYCASKWGVRGLTKTIRARSPRPASSAMARRAIPMQRQGTPLECAYLALFLASDESSFITGAEIAIDGGFTAGAAVWMRSRMREELAKAEAG